MPGPASAEVESGGIDEEVERAIAQLLGEAAGRVVVRWLEGALGCKVGTAFLRDREAVRSKMVEMLGEGGKVLFLFVSSSLERASCQASPDERGEGRSSRSTLSGPEG